jgi:hypothetical protein
VGLLLNEWLTLDATVGYGDTQTDQFRTAGGTRVSSDVESSRMFGSVNATATHSFDRLLVSGRTGLLYATQKDDSFVESNGTVIPEQRTNLGRFLIGGELAYSAGAWEPYVSGMYEHDFTSTSITFAPGVAQPRSDDSDVLFAVGLRYFGDQRLSGYVEYSKLIGDVLWRNLRCAKNAPGQPPTNAAKWSVDSGTRHSPASARRLSLR